MDAKEYLKQKYPRLDKFQGGFSKKQLLEFAEEYSQSQAQERLGKAWEYLEKEASEAEGGVVSYQADGYVIKALIRASGLKL
jgi:hypothetical protein